VIVSDNGVGLAEGKTWPTPGRLGAAIARSLLAASGGTIVAESVAAGACFRIGLVGV